MFILTQLAPYFPFTPWGGGQNLKGGENFQESVSSSVVR